MTIENIVGKAESVVNKHFLLFSHAFNSIIKDMLFGKELRANGSDEKTSCWTSSFKDSKTLSTFA